MAFSFRAGLVALRHVQSSPQHSAMAEPGGDADGGTGRAAHFESAATAIPL